MILVLAGTNPYSFERLLRPLDELAGKNSWDVFMQRGHTGYSPQHCKSEKFVERDRLLDLIEQSELVISQGGYGSIRDALLYNKPLLAVPRYPENGEATDHQEELVRAMEQLGYLIGVYDVGTLESSVDAARNFTPAPRGKSRIPDMLGEYLESL